MKKISFEHWELQFGEDHNCVIRDRSSGWENYNWQWFNIKDGHIQWEDYPSFPCSPKCKEYFSRIVRMKAFL